MNQQAYIGVGVVSTVCPLPCVERDVRTAADVFSGLLFDTTVLSGPVVPLDKIIEAAAACARYEHVVLHYSGHGIVVDGQFCLWLGSSVFIAPWAQVVAKVVDPLCRSCANVTVILDTCFSGGGIRGGKAEVPPGTVKPAADVKTVGSLRDAVPAMELVDEKASRRDNLAVMVACGRKEEADAEWVPMTRGGWATHSTEGHSLFSWALVQQLRCAQWIEYVCANNASYRRNAGQFRALRQIEQAISSQTAGMYTHFGSTRYQTMPPRVCAPNVQVRIGRQHWEKLF